MRLENRILSVALLLMPLAGCGKASESARTPAPAKVTNPPKEADLSTVTLTEQADKRLGVQVRPVEHKRVDRLRTYAGDVVVPAGHSIQVAAPVAGTVVGGVVAAGAPVRRGQVVLRLSPLPPAADLSAAGVKIDVARKKAERTERLFRAGAVSERVWEEAKAELDLAEASVAAGKGAAGAKAAGRAMTVEAPQSGLVTQLLVGPGQTVSAGTPLFQVDVADRVWVRVPVYVGELGAVDRARPARVRPLGAPPTEEAREATPAAAPPSANPLSATGDLYYQLDNKSGALQPGQKVDVTLPLTGDEDAPLVVPASAIVYDVHGGAWVYQRQGPHVYSRRRVEVQQVVPMAGQDWAVLARGPAAGTLVVITAVAELYGTEFGNGK